MGFGIPSCPVTGLTYIQRMGLIVMHRLLGILMILIMACLAAQAMAEWQNYASNYYRTGNSSSPEIGEQKAISIAQQHFKGRVLAINHSDNMYRVKVLNSQGIIQIILIDAANGAIIPSR